MNDTATAARRIIKARRNEAKAHRADYRAETDDRIAAEHAEHGVPAPATVQARINARTAEPVGFDDVNVGDRLVFATRDNGYGGSGELIDRTGVVTAVTAKTVTVQVDNPMPTRVFKDGKNRTYGLNARLRRDDWYPRYVRLQVQQP